MAQIKQTPQLDDLPTKGYDPVVTRQLLIYLKPFTLQLLTAVGLMMLSSFSSVAGPYLLSVALDSGLAKGAVDVLRDAVLLYLALAMLQWVAIYFRVYIMARVGQAIIYELRSRLFTHLQELSLSFFNRYSVGRIIVRVINDVTVLREFITWALLAITRDLFTLIFTIITMLTLDFRLALLAFTTLPLMFVLTALFKTRMRDNYRKTRTAISWVNSVVAENINGVRVVQSYSREDVNYAFFRDEVNFNNLQANLKAARLTALFFPSVDLLGWIAMAIVVFVGGSAVLGQQITPGVLVAFVLYINRFFEPIRDLSQRFDTFQSTMASGERVMALLGADVEVKDAPDAVQLPFIQGKVEFEHVSFHYSDDITPVLTEINLSVPPGQTVALVGKTGAGKTTMIKLLARFHDPTDGTVRVDGVDLRTVTQNSLRSQMGIVLQDPFLFSGTVKDNIRFGRLNATDAEIETAARDVGAHDFIVKLNSGYDTPVEEGGLILSVGQRQLISFARALLADPRILILDKATSSVDTQTEIIIQQALARLLQGRTSFVIAHRLSTVVNANLIVVIQDGRIIEQGTHAELILRQGVYFNLYSMNFEDEE